LAFLGFVNKIDAILNDASIMCSHLYLKGLPLSVLEAMNHKLALLMTDGCGFGAEFVSGRMVLWLKKQK